MASARKVAPSRPTAAAIGRHQRAWLSLVGALSLIGFVVPAVAGAPPAGAVHDDGIFQLDYVTSPAPIGAANVSSTNITPAGNTGDDWDLVYAGTSHSFAPTFVTDTVGPAETSFYTGGGSKDERPISTGSQHWQWASSNDVIPDKDDIAHAFAAAYAPTTGTHAGHTLIYFGADRFATDGDAELGFWFFRDRVTLGAEPDFVGEHVVGDILVLVNWSASKVADIDVYKWIGGKDPLVAVTLPDGPPDCSDQTIGNPVCAVVNAVGGETPPWSYTDKDGGHSYQAGALLEGGLDLTELLGTEDVGCYSGFLASTRSSHSTTAQLKDFAIGEFPLCNISVAKTGDTLSKIGDAVSYTVTIANTGHQTLYKRNISDTVLGPIATNGVNVNPSGFVLTNTCGASLAPGASCTITLQRTVLSTDPDPLPNTVTALYTEHADFSGVEITRSDDHRVNLFQPAVSIAKTGDPLSKVGDSVTYTFTITNLSSADTPNLTLASISDDVLGNLGSLATAAGCDVLTYGEVCSFSTSRTVTAGDPDPLVNTVDVLYHPVGFPNDVAASDGHSVNLFQPSVSVTKTGDALSKIGDDVTYRVTVTNTSSSDSPNLVLDSITDDVLGDLAAHATGCTSLAPGASCTFDVPWTVAPVDLNPVDGRADDPVINTVTVHFHPDGFSNDITATASHELNLFQPSIAFAKTADTQLSKVGDVVSYTLTLNNLSSPDTPAMVCTITDPMLGVSKTVTLASGAGDVTNVAYTVPAGAPDPMVNTAGVTCSPTGFPNVLSATSSWTVNLFQPGVTVVKGGDTLSKVGDGVTYTFTITNTSSADSPNLMLDSITDDVLGTLVAPAACTDLAPGASCSFQVPWTVPDGAPDPVTNTVEVLYHPVGFPNRITDTDTHSLNLFQPSMTFEKTGDALSKIGDPTSYTLTLRNTSSSDSPDLVCTVADPMLGLTVPVTLRAGATWSQTYPYTPQAGDPDPLLNTATATCSPVGFPNVLTGSSSHSTNLFQASVDLTKTGPALSKVGDPATYTVTITNTSSADSPTLQLASFTDSLMPGFVPPAACSSLAPGASCTFTYTHTVQAGDPDPLLNTATATYHPAGFPNDITDTASWTTNLFQPSVDIVKEGDGLSKVGDPVTYTVTIRNTSSADSPNLVLDSFADSLVGVRPPAACSPLAPGASCTFSYTRTVVATDPDPLVNTATVHYHPAGFPNDITDAASWTTNLFQPSVDILKTGDRLSKVGDPVTYSVTIRNTSSADSPNLVLDTFADSLVPEVTPPESCSPLPAGGSCTFTYTYTVQAADADPLLNTATVRYHPAGFPNELRASSTWSTNLVQPGVLLTKTADAQGKVGDPVTYTVTIRNTGSADSPALVLDSFTDTLVPEVALPESCSPLAAGASCSVTYTYTVRAGDPDPLVNTATVHYHPAGFPNDVWDSDAAVVDLFQPAVQLRMVADELSKATDPVTYRLTITNVGSADSPALQLASLGGTPFGDLTAAAAAAGCATLAPGASCTLTTTYTVQVSDADPLVATATAVFHPTGYPNDVVAVASATTNLFQPAISLTKTAQAQPAFGAPVGWTVTILNTSSPDSPALACTLSDPLLGVSEPLNLASGQTWTRTWAYTVQPTDPSPLRNTATVTCSPVGFPNVLQAVASAEVELTPETPTLPPELPPTGGGSDAGGAALVAVGALAAGAFLLAVARKRGSAA